MCNGDGLALVAVSCCAVLVAGQLVSLFFLCCRYTVVPALAGLETVTVILALLWVTSLSATDEIAVGGAEVVNVSLTTPLE